MGFFDFLGGTRRYRGRALGIKRLEVRRRFIVTPYVDELAGARVLDLASHDGRWSYALADAGAREVIGIEARRELIDQFEEYPDGPVKEKVSFVHADVFEELPRMVAAGERFDVVAIFGLYYHIMDHYQLLKLVKHLGPKLIVIDSMFLDRPAPLIRLDLEETSNHLSSISHETGQSVAPVGIPTRSALELMARTLGYDVTWADWGGLPVRQRNGVGEYFRPRHGKLRGTCALRPRD